jgi:hypothetical protein
MIEPYQTIFAEITPLLDRLRFSRADESSFGATFTRTDGYSLSVHIERTGEGFSAVLQKDGADIRGQLSPEVLMEAFEPSKGVEAMEALRNGFDENGIKSWWRIFLTFLIDHENVVFRLPSTIEDPSWRAYVEIHNRKVRESGIRSCSIINF